MAMFDRKNGELPPLLYNVGDKIMGYHMSMGVSMLVGGEIVERKQSTSYLDENEYKVKLEPELCQGCEEGRELTWWINEKEAKLFKQGSNNYVRVPFYPSIVCILSFHLMSFF